MEFDDDRLNKCPLRAHSVRIPPSAVSVSPPSCGWSGRPSSFWSPLFGGRQSVGRRDSGRPPPAVLRWSFAGKHMLDSLADWWRLQRHRRSTGGWGLFAPQLIYPRSLGAGVTPAVHSHGPAPLATVVTANRKGAHGRVNFDRAVDRSRCEADQTSGIASPRGSLARLSSQVSRRGVLLVFRHAVDSNQHGRSAPVP